MNGKWAILALLPLWPSMSRAGNAVEDLNGKVDFSAGTMNAHWGENLAASLALPVSPHLGLQADGLFTHVGQQNFDGGGLHFFWRDSEKGLLGLTAAGLDGNALYGIQCGVEAEYYLKRFTLGGNLGFASIQYDSPAPFINTRPTDVYATASLSYYPVDNLMLQGAYSRFFDGNLGELSLEYQTPVRGLSCFAEIAKGENGYDQALFGLRYYFGKDKSLIRRHREDDPTNLLNRMLTSIGTYGAKYNRAMHAYASENPGSGYSSTGGDYGSDNRQIIWSPNGGNGGDTLPGNPILDPVGGCSPHP